MLNTSDAYVRPVLRDYGSLVQITQGADFRGFEDGGSKIEPLPHHSAPVVP